MVRLRLVDASELVGVFVKRDPLGLGDNTLSVSQLEAIFLHLIRVLAERILGIACECLDLLFPEVGLDGSVFSDDSP